MRIAITGATGNVGTALLRVLDGRGHDLVGVVRRPPATGSPYAGIDWRAVDLTAPADEARLGEAFTGADAVVHLAWGFQPSHRLALLEELGVGGTRRVLDAAADAGVGHVVHMSSVGAYAARRDLRPVGEDHPTTGVPSSPYSRHKAAAERLVDELERSRPDVVVTRVRPGIIGQRSAGSELLRYAWPGWLPAALLRAVPLLPLDRRLVVPFVHSEDVADALVRMLEGQVGGAFNLAADPPATAEDVAAVLRARLVPAPARLLRAGVAAAWTARLLQLDPGWIDLAYSVPMLDSTRAEDELGWSPRHSGLEVLEEVVAGMMTATADATPVMRPRDLADNARAALAHGPVHRRSDP